MVTRILHYTAQGQLNLPLFILHGGFDLVSSINQIYMIPIAPIRPFSYQSIRFWLALIVLLVEYSGLDGLDPSWLH